MDVKATQWLVAVVAVALSVAISAFVASSVARCRADQAAAFAACGGGNAPGISVSGTSEVRAAPDLATVRLGHNSRGQTARQAKLANDRAMAKILSAIRSEGVDRKDIQTVQYGLYGAQEGPPRAPRRVWYVRNLVEVRVRKVATVADVMDAASAAGANQMGDVRFDVENLHTLRAKARIGAAKVAREKAEQLAKLMGVRLGRPVAISDVAADSYWSPWNTRSRNVLQKTTQMPPSETMPDSAISGGQVSVQVREEVLFEIR